MKILILTSSTGGGHDMRARSFAAWARQAEAKALGLEVDIFQTLEETHSLYHFGVGVYNWIQRRYPNLHHAYFNALEVANLHRSGNRIVGSERFAERLAHTRPSIVLSTHAHLNHGFFDLARDALCNTGVACATYCGELFGGYGFSKHWVNPRADLFIGAVDETCQQAQRLGMKANQNWRGGFLLKPGFYSEPLSDTQRRHFIEEKLDLDPDRFILLLATGANSAVNHISFLNALRKSRLDPLPQVIALCGRSQENVATIQEWSDQYPDFPVKTLGYCDNMHTLLQCASAIVARPGTGTTSEAILSRCPIIFNGLGGIMPQEFITVKFARRHGFAYVVNQPVQLPFIIERMNRREGLTDRIRNKMATVSPDRRPVDILQRVRSLGEQKR